jgi:hypothetical protein
MMDGTRNVVKTQEVVGVDVKDENKDNLGKIEEVMLDKESGRVAYAVLACGGFLGIGEKLFAIPWHAFHYDPEQKAFLLDADKEKLKNAPSFDKDHWPDMADRTWGQSVSNYYGSQPYWE